MYSLLANRSFMRLLLVVNLLGAIYGYIWYLPQLQITKMRYWLFVADSPTALLFFFFVFVAFLGNIHWPLMESLAFVCLVKYGLWAIFMNTFFMISEHHFILTSMLLLITHALMVAQAILYAPFYRIRLSHFMVAAIWVLHNDVIDYLCGQMPIYKGLEKFIIPIGYLTFWLSILVLCYVYEKTLKKKRFILNFPHNE